MPAWRDTYSTELLPALMESPRTTSEIQAMFPALRREQVAQMIADLNRRLRDANSDTCIAGRKTHIPTKFGRTAQVIYTARRI